MAKKNDYLSGVYRGGVFNAYDMNGDYSVTKFETGTNSVAKDLANAQKEVHGTYRGGVFRPANLDGEKGYASNLTINGETLGVSHTGELYDKRGSVIGKLTRDGKVQSHRNSGHNLEDKSGENRGRSKKMVTSSGVRDFYETGQVNSVTDWMIRSNEVLGKLGAEKTGYRIPKNFVAYETEIPEFRRDRNGLPLFGAYNGRTEDGQTVLVVDSRLKPYEELALVSHELAHIAQNHNPKTDAERDKNEREAQTSAIKQMTTLYEDYEELQNAVKNSGDNAFFNVGRVSKKDIAKAVGLLVDARKYFGVVDDDLVEHRNTFRSVAKDLEGMVASIFLISSLFFFSTKITGNVIGLSTQTFSWIGAGLLCAGLVAGFFWVKRKI